MPVHSDRAWPVNETAFRFGYTPDTLYCFVADQLSNGSADTLTFTCTGDAATGVIIMPIRVAGGPSGRLGARAVRQFNVVDSQAGADHPKPSFSANAQTGNGCLGFVASATSPPAITPPT